SAVNAANGWKVVGDPTPHAEIALQGAIAVTTYYATTSATAGSRQTTVAGNYIGTDVNGNGRGTTGWWKGENNANDAVDGSNGTLNGGATFATGKVGQAFSFNGISSFVQVPHSSRINPIASFSIEAWVNLAAYPTLKSAPIISKWNDLSTNQRSFILFVNPSGAVRFDVSTNGNFSAASPAPPLGSSDAQVLSAPGA